MLHGVFSTSVRELFAIISCNVCARSKFDGENTLTFALVSDTCKDRKRNVCSPGIKSSRQLLKTAKPELPALSSTQGSDAVLQLRFARRTRAMKAAEDLAIGFHTMPHDPAVAVRADPRQRLDRAFEAIE